MGNGRAIEEAAATWFAKRDGADWRSEDQVELDAWLNEATAHRIAFLRIEAAWRESARLKALGAGLKVEVIPEPGQWRLSPFFDEEAQADTASQENISATRHASHLRRLFTPWHGAAAACIAVIFAFGGVWYGMSRPETTFRTAVGGLETVPLADGSKVTLNTASEIHVALNDHIRTVELEHGEAFFEVAKDPNRPFVVDTGGKRVIAVGTKFSVKREVDGIRVTVTEGRVRIESDAPTVEPPSQVSAGETAHTGGAGTLVQTASLPDLEEQLSWRTGYVVFHATNLSEAVDEFNRYNTRKLVIADPTLAEIRIGGNFQVANVDAFVRLLEQGFPIHAAHDGAKIVLTRN